MILILYIVFIVLVLVGLGWLKQNISQQALTKDFKNVFKNSQIELPTLKIGSSYSWPTFDITFATRQDLEFAEASGLVNEFKNKIRTRYAKDFDPDKAIYCRYIGHVPAWKIMLGEEKNGKS